MNEKQTKTYIWLLDELMAFLKDKLLRQDLPEDERKTTEEILINFETTKTDLINGYFITQGAEVIKKDTEVN